MEKREGRGRLSSIELLPAEADEAVAWAAAELIDRTRTADDIHAEFNGKLAAIGLGPISRSAFGRYSIRQSSLARRREVTREIVAAINAKLNIKDMDELSIVLGDTLKMVVFETLERGAEKGFSPKDLLITVVLQPNGDGHAVLTVRTDYGDYILDNMRGDVRLWSETGYTFVKRQSSEHAARWTKLGPGSATAVGTVKN